jgi:predicted restriction endonuclease
MNFKLKKYNKRITDEQLKADLRRVAKILSKETVFSTEYRIHGKYSVSSVRYRFGSWNNAMKCAGLKIWRHNQVNKYELLMNLKRLWVKLKRQPVRKDLTFKNSEYSVYAYERHFGGIYNALCALIKLVNSSRKYKSDSLYSPYRIKTKKHKTTRDVNTAQRFKVMERDDFTCVKCGRSPATEKGVRLEIDHIKPYSKGGETVISNLQTLCRECNIGKGSR